MLLKFATNLFGTSNDRMLKKFSKDIEPINELEPKFEAMSDDELKAQTAKFRQRYEDGESLDDMLHEAFAVVRETAKRTLGQRHYDVQLVGGLVLHSGMIAEMKTGEGKTLVSTLPVYLNALTGKGVHVVTVNDYLAARDAEWMGAIYTFLGLSVGCITNNMSDEERKIAYNCDITYGTNNEFGFDYLRDNMKFDLDEMVQREPHYAIIDEVDSILIDEARTPLIISGPAEGSVEMYQKVDSIIPELNEEDYELDEKLKTVNLGETGSDHVEELLKQHGLLEEGNLYDPQNISLVHHVNQALRAHKLFSRDTDYVVKDNKVVIVDEFTGRMMEGRRFSEGLHQALEAKENVQIQMENQTLASITFQNLFRLYPKLAGMTGTALTEASEFMEIYKLAVVAIPTHKPIARIDNEDKIYKNLQEKEDAIVSLIKDCYDRKQPVLVGTVSIEKSEKLAARLKKHKIPHNILNARYHEKEAQIIAQAGRPGAITIATNMAGRGTDIQLGGNFEMRVETEIDPNLSDEKKTKAIEKIKNEIEEHKDIVREAGGLFVIGTERHESRRIDNQLRGRSGRQGDPGETQFFLSLEDDLMRIFGSDRMESILAHKRIGLQEGESLTHPWISKLLERAQTKVEAQNFEIRKNLLKYDDVMNDQRKVIYEQRREIMESDDISDLVEEMRFDCISDIVEHCIPPKAYPEQWDVDTLRSEIKRVLVLDLPVDDWAKEEGIAEKELEERIQTAANKRMEAKAQQTGRETFRQVEKALVLQILDQHWKEHLLNLDHLRQGINLRAFGQRDPLNEYKTEAFSLFEMMLDSFRENVTQTLMMIDVNIGEGLFDGMDLRDENEDQHWQTTRIDPALMGTGTPAAHENDGNVLENALPGSAGSFEAVQERKPFDENDPSTWGKTPRNAPCPCGSGKKYKHCHGKVT